MRQHQEHRPSSSLEIPLSSFRAFLLWPDPASSSSRFASKLCCFLFELVSSVFVEGLRRCHLSTSRYLWSRRSRVPRNNIASHWHQGIIKNCSLFLKFMSKYINGVEQILTRILTSSRNWWRHMTVDHVIYDCQISRRAQK